MAILARVLILYGFGAAVVLLTSGAASGRAPTMWVGVALLVLCLLMLGGRARLPREEAPDVLAYMQPPPGRPLQPGPSRRSS